jgi:hypothetical protein
MAIVATLTGTNPYTDRPFRARGVAPVPLATDLNLCFVPAALPPEQERPVQYRITGSTSTFNIVEFITVLGPGTASFEVHDGYVEPAVFLDPVLDPSAGFTPRFYGAVESFIARPDSALLRVIGHGDTETVNLSAPPTAVVRSGRYMRTWLTHHHTKRYGGFHVWVTINAFSREIEIDINWHNGIPRADILFRALKFLVRGDEVEGLIWKWVPRLDADLIMNPGLDALVTAGNHILPQRFERLFRIILHPEAEPPEIPRYDRGLFFHNWQGGGYLPHGLEMPSLAHVANLGANVLATYNAQKGYLIGDVAGPTNDPVYGTPGRRSLSRFLPAYGVPYGGATSGEGIDFHPGVRIIASRQPEGILLHMLRQLRYRSRGVGNTYCDIPAGAGTPFKKIGAPMTAENNLDANGFAPWAMDSFGNFLKQGGIVRDNPWGWHNYPRPAGPIDYDPTPAPSGSQHSSFGAFDRIDCAHWLRAMRDNMVLAYLSADPPTLLYLQGDGEMTKMIQWYGPGSWAPTRVLNPAARVDAGMNWTRDQAWATVQNCFTAIFSRANRLDLAKAFVKNILTNLENAQMANGLLQAFSYLEGGKAVNQPPFGNNVTATYFVAQTFGEFYWIIALAAIRETFGEAAFALPGGRQISAMITDVARGLRDMSWHTDADGQTISGTGHNGPWKRVPLGPYPGAPATRYATRANFVPTNICPKTDTWTYAIANEARVMSGDFVTYTNLSNPRVYTASIVVTNTAGTVTYVLNTDYELSTTGAPTGAGTFPGIRRKSGGAITPGQTVHVDYNYLDITWDNSLDSYWVGDPIGLAMRYGRDCTTDVLRMTDTASLAAAKTALEAAGLTYDKFADAPIENWAALLKELQG